MKRQRKKVDLETRATEFRSGLCTVFLDQPREWFATARARMQDLPKTNFDLGCNFAERGLWYDAMFRFRVTLYLDKNYPQALYNLGCCYMRLGKKPEAKQAFLSILKKNPRDQDALFMLAMVDPRAVPASHQPQHMPMEMVVSFYNDNAANFDTEEANKRYQAGLVVHELAAPFLATPTPRVLDLACGTGIAARPWRAAAAAIRGVDITPAMLAVADAATHAEKKLYDALTSGDVTSLPADVANGSWDVVQLVNAAHFIGELSGVVQGAAQAMHPQGIFVITLEPYNGLNGFGLDAETTRFGHSAAYVREVAGRHGLTPLKEVAIELYAGVPAQAMVFAKDAR